MELGGGGRKTKDSFEKAGGCARTRLSLSRLGLRRRSQVTAGPGLRVPPPLPPGRAGAAAGFDASRARPGQFLTPWPELRQSLRAPSLPSPRMQNVINTVKGKALEVAEYLTPVLKVSGEGLA